MSTPPSSTWALILAGGDGTRLRPLTTRIVGDPRPKQFYPLLDGETLLQRTRRRADLVARFDHQVVVVTRTHAPYYQDLAMDLAPGRLVAQPINRGTAPGLLYPLLRIRQLAGNVPVAVFPSDHHVDDDQAFAAYVQSAVAVVRAEPERVVLLGMEPDQPETEYGWIQPGDVLIPEATEPAFRIERFWEKPSVAVATRLLGDGCLWNSFVMVGHVDAFLDLARCTAPELVAAFESIDGALGTLLEDRAVNALYVGLPSLNFSESVLAPGTARLATVRVKGIGWSDWGNPVRLVASLRRVGREPDWLHHLEFASTA